MVEVNSKLYKKLRGIANNLHPTNRLNKDLSFPRYVSVTENVPVRRLHCSSATSEPVRCKSCYTFLAGTESAPVEGARSVKDSSEQCKR